MFNFGWNEKLYDKEKESIDETSSNSTSSVFGFSRQLVKSDFGNLPAPNRGCDSQRIQENDMSLSDLGGWGSIIYAGKMTDDIFEDKSEGVRKSNRVPKRRIIDGSFEDGRHLDKLIYSKVSADNELECEDGSNKKRSISRVLKRESDRPRNLDTRVSQDIKSRSGKSSDENDYSDEEDILSGEDLGGSKRKKAKKFGDTLGESRKELAVTTRQRALQTGKDVSISGGSLIEFPNGLPSAHTRKQKEKLSDLEQQRRAEALQKRRMQAEAIRKILGQDSSRKKKENQIKKRQVELAQEKAANSMKLAPHVVRWTSGLNGIFVTFPEEMGLPSVFKQESPSYPPPRENCAGPSCPNTYKYRCSKTKLPLCSLQCYKAIRVPKQPSTACQ
uniref:INO80 complex subunit B-like conserved region domain-containing protein n=1 Tax=Kalanchoe fedtschenkoi TaxID=63787 RepID=A0A7N0TF22_KALFE